MTKKRTEIYQFMNKKLGKELIEELISYCEAHNYDHGSLWGLQQPSKFLSDMVYLMLYKDFKNIGYCALEEELDFSYKITHNSLQHNIQVIRLRLSDWADNQFHLGNLDEWKHTAADCGLKSKVKNANLWVDSTDFRTTGRSTMSKKSSWWSYKEDSPARRYLIVFDGHGHVKRFWGGYPPKQYDGDFLREHKTELSEAFNGATIIADNHFSVGKKIFKDISFLTNYAIRDSSKKRKHGDNDGDGDVDVLTKQHKEFNKQHEHARARVESAFGWMKRKFAALRDPWHSSEGDQLDCLVKIAAALYSRKM